MERDFPDGFLWGTSTAAHQVEGGNVNNDWWAWEHTPGSTAIEPSGDAIDQYHRYAADFDSACRPGAQRPPLLPGVVAHRTRPRRVEPGRDRPLPARPRRSGRSRPDRLHDPLPLHGPRLVRRTRRLGRSRRRRPVRPLRRADRAAHPGPDPVCLHGQRAADRRAVRLPPRLPPARPAQPAPVAPGDAPLIGAHEAAVDILAGGPQTGVSLQMPDLQPARATTRHASPPRRGWSAR